MWSPIVLLEIINYYESERDNKFLPRFIKHSKYKMVLPIQGIIWDILLDDHKQLISIHILRQQIAMKIIYGENDPFFR